METLNLETLVEQLKKLEMDNPNDYDLGKEIRKMIRKNFTEKN